MKLKEPFKYINHREGNDMLANYENTEDFKKEIKNLIKKTIRKELKKFSKKLELSNKKVKSSLVPPPLPSRPY